MARHQDQTGSGAVHQFAYKQSSDPGAVGAKKGWIDTTSGPPYELKVRNDANTAWETVGSTGSGSAVAVEEDGSEEGTGIDRFDFTTGMNLSVTGTQATVSGSDASETAKGIVELATDAETQTGTDTARAITPANLSARSATETRSGVIELATQAETDAGTDDARAVTPLKLATYSGLGSGGGSRALVTLGSDVTNSTTSLADVTGLSFSATSGTIYRFYALIIYQSAATTTGVNFSVNGPSSPTLVGYKMTWPGTTGTTLNIVWQVAYDAGAVTTASPAANVPLIAEITGAIQPSTTGTFVVRFASEVASSAITVKAGSTLEYW